MKTYEVEVSRTVTDLLYTTVLVEADSPEGAEHVAIARAQSGCYDSDIWKDRQLDCTEYRASVFT